MLEEAGSSVCLANNGQEALALLHQLAELRVLAMTATATSEDRVRCLDAGMDDFISKPIQPALMYQTIANWLPAQRAEDSDAVRVGEQRTPHPRDQERHQN
eukprot:gene20766-23585_t